MIHYILSSLRPFNQSRQYADLQIAAFESWKQLGSRIIYFNTTNDTWLKEEFQMEFVTPKQNPPTIYEMISWAIQQGNAETSIAIVNSDIILGKDINLVEEVVRTHNMTRNWAATSFRYTYDPLLGLHNAKRDPFDFGLDIFIAPRRIWEVLHKEMAVMGATKLTIGRIIWDNTVNAYFRERLPSNRYFDLTDWRVVFHPVHGERGRHVHYDKNTLSELKILGSGGIPQTRYAKPDSPDGSTRTFYASNVKRSR